MTEEILINGVALDIDASFKGIQMVFQSPYLTDFSSIVSNRTNSVTFPATNHNKMIIGCASLQQDSDFAYRKHRAVYRRDGVQMFDGKATLLSVTDKNIQMCFTWGNTDAFQTLFDTNLQELDLGRCKYPAGVLTTNSIPLVKFGGGRSGVGVSVLSILNAIEAKCGVSGLSNLAHLNSSRNYALALTTRNGDTTTRAKQGLVFGTLGAKSIASGTFYGRSVLKNASGGTDPHHIMDSDGMIAVEGYTSLHINLKGTFRMTKRVSTDFDHDMLLVRVNQNGNYSTSRLCTGTIISTSSSTYVVEYSPNIDADYGMGNDVQYCFIQLFNDTLGGSGFEPTLSNISMTAKTIVPDSNEGEEVMYDTGIADVYPVGLNLPNMSCGQFIKNLLWLHGGFAFSLDGKTFEFASFSDLTSNKENALDWTDKMITVQPKERQTKLDTARKNYFRYKEADWYDNSKYQGVLRTDDETIDEEKEYCKSDFALIPQNEIPVWSLNDDNEWDFAGDNLPPILVAGYTGVVVITACYNSAQRWSNLLSRFYVEYAAMIQHPVIIKADFLITTADINALDMRIPVYLKQTGRYYAIRKLTTKNAKVAEAELIELK